MQTSRLIHWVGRVFACIGVLSVAHIFFTLIHFYTHPAGPITNCDYPLIQLADASGSIKHEISRGESKLVLYGEYTVFIPENNATFLLMKNHRGRCNIRSANGVLLVETDRNSTVLPYAP